MSYIVGSSTISDYRVGATAADRVYVNSEIAYQSGPVTIPFPFDNFNAAATWLQNNTTNVTGFIQGTMNSFLRGNSGQATMWRPSSGEGSLVRRYNTSIYPYAVNHIRWRYDSATRSDWVFNKVSSNIRFRDNYPTIVGNTIATGFRNVMLNYDEQAALAFVNRSEDEPGFNRNLAALSAGGNFMAYDIDNDTLLNQANPPNINNSGDLFDSLSLARFFYISGNYAVLNDIFSPDKK